MMFVRYKGMDESKFVRGKTYIALNGRNNVIGGSIDVFLEDKFERIHPTSSYYEDGQQKWNYDFDFIPEVYAVLGNDIADHKKGQVVVLDDAGINTVTKSVIALSYSVVGFGYVYSSNTCRNIIILDKTNVFPGMVVLDESSGIWCKIETVDEALWVKTECSECIQSPEAFRFYVDQEGEIASEPIVCCKDNTDGLCPGVTKGRWYIITREEFMDTEEHVVFVVNDMGEEKAYSANRFF